MSTTIDIDVSNWCVEKWVNDKQLYNDCYEFLSVIPDKIGGVYYIYKDDDLMYIGATKNFKQRITDHLVVNSNTKDFINSATRVKCVPIEKEDERAIFEYMEILEKKPMKNKVLPRLTRKQKETMRLGITIEGINDK